jgi:hypothetical protein
VAIAGLICACHEHRINIVIKIQLNIDCETHTGHGNEIATPTKSSATVATIADHNGNHSWE